MEFWNYIQRGDLMKNNPFRFIIGMKIDHYYSVEIIADNYSQRKMVKEEDIDGYIQCLHDLGYEG